MPWTTQDIPHQDRFPKHNYFTKTENQPIVFRKALGQTVPTPQSPVFLRWRSRALKISPGVVTSRATHNGTASLVYSTAADRAVEIQCRLIPIKHAVSTARYGRTSATRHVSSGTLTLLRDTKWSPLLHSTASDSMGYASEPPSCELDVRRRRRSTEGIIHHKRVQSTPTSILLTYKRLNQEALFS